MICNVPSAGPLSKTAFDFCCLGLSGHFPLVRSMTLAWLTKTHTNNTFYFEINLHRQLNKLDASAR